MISNKYSREETVLDILYALVSFIIAAFVFIYGTTKLFKKRKPLYWKLIVCAVGCFALQQLSYVIRLWCGATEEVNIGTLGILGCNIFLFSANFGTLDGIVDDGTGSRRARYFALLAPAFLALLSVAVFFAWKDKNLFYAVIWIVLMLPALAASYFNLKHLILPLDPFEFLRATKQSNIAALIFYGLTVVYGFVSAFSSIVSGLLSIVMSVMMFVLVLCAIRGAKKWTT